MARLGACAVLLAGCGGPLDVDGPALTGAAAATCADLLAALPEAVDDVARAEVDAGDGYAAGWGDPPIVLRCGVPMPEEFTDYATCHETNGVGWFIPDEQVTGSPEQITMTTIGRDVNVEVSLPPEHWPPANAMVDLAAAIKATTEELDRCV